MKKLTPEQKQTLKQFKDAQRGIPDALHVIQRELKKRKKAIREALLKGPLTVPGIARETGLPQDLVLWQLTTMRKYGEIKEVEQEGDYPQYALDEGEKRGEAGEE